MSGDMSGSGDITDIIVFGKGTKEDNCFFLERVIASSTNLAQYRKYKADCERYGCGHCQGDTYTEFETEENMEIWAQIESQRLASIDAPPTTTTAAAPTQAQTMASSSALSSSASPLALMSLLILTKIFNFRF